MKHEEEIVKQTGITRTRLRVARMKHLKRGKHWEKEGRLIMYTKEGEKEILSVLGFPKETKLVEPKPQIEEQMTVEPMEFPARWDGRAWFLARNCPRFPGRWKVTDIFLSMRNFSLYVRMYLKRENSLKLSRHRRETFLGLCKRIGRSHLR